VRISGVYSHKDGEEYVESVYPHLLREIRTVIESIDAETCRLKKPKGKEQNRATRIGVKLFFSPPHLNALFDWHFFNLGWDIKPRIKTHDRMREGYREIDVVKERLGVELQFGKYSFLTYDIIAKMVIFNKVGLIDCGVELCVMASMLPHMSSGIGAFEQVVWDLRTRGEADIDIPALVLGIESDEFYRTRMQKGADVMPSPTLAPEMTIQRYSSLSHATLSRVRETGIDT